MVIEKIWVKNIYIEKILYWDHLLSPSILKSIANQEPSLEPNAVVLERLLVRPFELRFSDETPFQLDIALLHSFTTFNLMTLEALSIEA